MLIKYMRRTHASLLTLITTQTRAMTATCRNVDWRWLDTTPSTMDAAKELLAARSDDDARPLAVATAHQTSGRGTRGRSWTDDGRGNVALTVAFPSPIPLTPITLLPLRVGTLVIEALNDSRLSLKWPNDVLLEGGKVAGMPFADLAAAWTKPFAPEAEGGCPALPEMTPWFEQAGGV